MAKIIYREGCEGQNKLFCIDCPENAYRDEIDKVLVNNAGDSLDNCYWTCAEVSAYDSFIYGGYDGILGNDDKANPYSVRPIKNLKEE